MKIAIYFAIVCVLFSCFFVYMHELNHQRIFESHGIPSTIHIGFPDCYVSPDVSTPACDSNCNLEHTINDSVGYNIQGLMMILATGLFVIIALLEEKRKDKVRRRR